MPKRIYFAPGWAWTTNPSVNNALANCATEAYESMLKPQKSSKATLWQVVFLLLPTHFCPYAWYCGSQVDVIYNNCYLSQNVISCFLSVVVITHPYTGDVAGSIPAGIKESILIQGMGWLTPANSKPLLSSVLTWKCLLQNRLYKLPAQVMPAKKVFEKPTGS